MLDKKLGLRKKAFYYHVGLRGKAKILREETLTNNYVLEKNEKDYSHREETLTNNYVLEKNEKDYSHKDKKK